MQGCTYIGLRAGETLAPILFCPYRFAIVDLYSKGLMCVYIYAVSRSKKINL